MSIDLTGDSSKQDLRPRPSARTPFSNAELSVVIGLSYVVGYLIANHHFGKWSVTAPDLLSVQYLAAAGLFVAFLVLPTTAAIVALADSREHVRVSGDERPGQWLGIGQIWAARGTWGWAFRIGLLSQGFFLGALMYDPFPIGAIWGFGSFVATWLVLLLWLRAEYPLAPVVPRPGVALSPGQARNAMVLAGFMALLMAATYFGGVLYPRIDPSVGGGAGWTATAWVATVEEGPIVGILVRRGTRSTSFLHCSDSSFVSSTFPTEQVLRIDLAELIPLDVDAIRTHFRDCGLQLGRSSGVYLGEAEASQGRVD